jgi:hypothetical protein
MTSPLPRRLMRFAARVLVGVLLFAQYLLAAHACTSGHGSNLTAGPHGKAMACHSQPAADAGTCLTHCSSADQSLDTPQVVVAAMPATALLTLPPDPDAASMDETMAARDPDPGGPVQAIRFRVLRI